MGGWVGGWVVVVVVGGGVVSNSLRSFTEYIQ